MAANRLQPWELALEPRLPIALLIMMMDDQPRQRAEPTADISVIIPHYNDLDRLSLCLDALTRQRGVVPLEIIVADNGSPLDERVLLERINGRARLVHAPDRGAGPARNAGVAASTSAMLAFTDADCVPEPDWLANGITALSTGDLVGGQMTVFVEHHGPKSAAEAFEAVFAFDNAAYVADKGFSVTANLFTRRDVFDRVGGFRVGVSEDLDWCRRATALGFRLIYCPDASVGHPARANWPQLKHKWLRIQSETFALGRPGMANTLTVLLRAWAMPLSIVADLPKIWRSRLLSGSGERWAATQGLIRLRFWRMIDLHRLLFNWRR